MNIDQIFSYCDSLGLDATFYIYNDESNYYECSKRFNEYCGFYEFIPSHLAMANIRGFKFSKDLESIFVLLA